MFDMLEGAITHKKVIDKMTSNKANGLRACELSVEVSALAPADLIAPSPRSYHMYYTPSPTYGNFCFVRVQELTEIQHSYH